MLGQLNAQNAKLTSEMLTLSQTLAARQKQDSTLTTTALAARHESLVGVTGVNYTENGYLSSPVVELQTVELLESLPVLKQELSDETQVADNKDKQITSINTVVTGLNDQINGLNLQLTDSSKACDTRVAVARKSRWKWFKYGFITGFLSGAYVGHKIP